MVAIEAHQLHQCDQVQKEHRVEQGDGQFDVAVVAWAMFVHEVACDASGPRMANQVHSFVRWQAYLSTITIKRAPDRRSRGRRGKEGAIWVTRMIRRTYRLYRGVPWLGHTDRLLEESCYAKARWDC